MPKLRFYYGTMDSGKSTLALQMRHNLHRVGRRGLLITTGDRSGQAVVTSRIGISAPALAITARTNLYELVARQLKTESIGFIVADEAQFYRPRQIDHLAAVADMLDTEVYAFGLLTDFRGLQFPGSKRLVEVADSVIQIQSEARCWCGQLASFQARIIAGEVTRTGPQVLIGDTDTSPIRYQVLCRKHFNQGLTGPSSADTD